MPDKKRIFIADDDYTILDSLRKLLTMSDFEVESTSNTRDIVSKVKLFKPHLILLDLLMPHLGGLEICELLDNDKETQGIPIIIVSALSDRADVKRAQELGVIGYVTKPYDYNNLLQEIKKVIK